MRRIVFVFGPMTASSLLSRCLRLAIPLGVAVLLSPMHAQSRIEIGFDDGEVPPGFRLDQGWYLDPVAPQAGGYSLRGPAITQAGPVRSAAARLDLVVGTSGWLRFAHRTPTGGPVSAFDVNVDGVRLDVLAPTLDWAVSSPIRVPAGRRGIFWHHYFANAESVAVALDSLVFEPIALDPQWQIGTAPAAGFVPPTYGEQGRGLLWYDVDGDGQREVVAAAGRGFVRDRGISGRAGYWFVADHDASGLQTRYVAGGYDTAVVDLDAYTTTTSEPRLVVATAREVHVHALFDGAALAQHRLIDIERRFVDIHRLAIGQVDEDGEPDLVLQLRRTRPSSASNDCWIEAHSLDLSRRLWASEVQACANDLQIGDFAAEAGLEVATTRGHLLSLRTGERLNPATPDREGVLVVRRDAPLGHLLVHAAGGAGTAQVTDLRSGADVRQLPGQPVLAADSTSDGRDEIFMYTADASLTVFDAGDGQALHAIAVPPAPLEAALDVSAQPPAAVLLWGSNAGLAAIDLALGDVLGTVPAEHTPLAELGVIPAPGEPDPTLVYSTFHQGANLRGLAAQSLQPRWTRPLPATAEDPSLPWGLAVDSDALGAPRVLLGVERSLQSRILMFDAHGAPAGEVVLPPPTGARNVLLALGADRVALMEGTRLYALSLLDASVLWERPDVGSRFGTMLLADADLDGEDEIVLVANGAVAVIEVVDGATAWLPEVQHARAVYVDAARGILLVGSDHLLSDADTPRIEIFDLASRALIRTLALSGPPARIGTLSLSGRELVFATLLDDVLEVLDAQSGSVLTSQRLPWPGFADGFEPE